MRIQGKFIISDINTLENGTKMLMISSGYQMNSGKTTKPHVNNLLDILNNHNKLIFYQFIMNPFIMNIFFIIVHKFDYKNIYLFIKL